MPPIKPVQVAFFTGCTVNYLDPSIGSDALSVLRRNGVDVLYPQQKCCGVPLLANGNHRGFKHKAAFNAQSLNRTDCDIITPCTSCAIVLKKEYPSLMKESLVQKVAERIYDLMEYLANMQKDGRLDTAFKRLDLFVLYHAPCHLKCLGQELIDARLRLLQRIPGIRLERIDRGCCGMGGTFGMKKQNFAISMSIGSALADGIRQAKPDLVVTECPGCKMQIEHISGANVQHPIHLIRLAYG
jgi:glycerol-3-phosphate dehydrogenase subunit C